MSTFEDIVKMYDQYSMDGPGSAIKEIGSLQFLWNDEKSFDSPDEPVDPDQKLVVVLLESRLLDTIASSRYSTADLLTCLLNYKYDLQREGRQPKFVKISLYSGPVRQDGKTLLAIRSFFKTINDTYAKLRRGSPHRIVPRCSHHPDPSGYCFSTLGASSDPNTALKTAPYWSLVTGSVKSVATKYRYSS